MSRKLLKELYFTSVNEVKAKALISQNIKLFDEGIEIVDKTYIFKRHKNIYVFSVGKASYLMAKSVREF